MAKVICKLPNASSLISGVKFVTHKVGMISEEIADEVAAEFTKIEGYVLAAVEKAAGGEKPAGGKKPQGADKSAGGKKDDDGAADNGADPEGGTPPAPAGNEPPADPAAGGPDAGKK